MWSGSIDFLALTPEVPQAFRALSLHPKESSRSTEDFARHDFLHAVTPHPICLVGSFYTAQRLLEPRNATSVN